MHITLVSIGLSEKWNIVPWGTTQTHNYSQVWSSTSGLVSYVIWFLMLLLARLYNTTIRSSVLLRWSNICFFGLLALQLKYEMLGCLLLTILQDIVGFLMLVTKRELIKWPTIHVPDIFSMPCGKAVHRGSVASNESRGKGQRDSLSPGLLTLFFQSNVFPLL
jgi:hypothetical protein